MSAFLDVTRSNSQGLDDKKQTPSIEELKFSHGLSVDDGFPCSDGEPVDSELQELVPGLLKSILMRIWEHRLDYLFVIDMGLYYGDGCVSPDGLLSLGVEQTENEQKRSSYILSQEKVLPVLVLEVVSKTYGGEFDVKLLKYQEIGILYYVIYAPLLDDAERFYVYNLVDGVYVLQVGVGDEQRVWLPEVGLAIGCERQQYDRTNREWLYWYDEAGLRYPTPGEAEKAAVQLATVEAERANAEAERANAEAEKVRLLRERLKELGFDSLE
jgi:Uma2 family endonuclease